MVRHQARPAEERVMSEAQRERDGVYIISVAAKLVDMHPSTLRKYEGCGLLEPCRLSGRLRLYSAEDIARLRQIKALIEEHGVNLAGVKLMLGLAEYARLLRYLADGEGDITTLRQQLRDCADQMLALLGVSDPAGERETATSQEKRTSE
jgi:MerR family transcriptional regulator/heat shock protein HspR